MATALVVSDVQDGDVIRPPLSDKKKCQHCGGPLVVDDGKSVFFCQCQSPRCQACGEPLSSHAGRGPGYFHRIAMGVWPIQTFHPCSYADERLDADGMPTMTDDQRRARDRARAEHRRRTT